MIPFLRPDEYILSIMKWCSNLNFQNDVLIKGYIYCADFIGGEVTGYHSWVHDNFYKASLH